MPKTKPTTRKPSNTARKRSARKGRRDERDAASTSVPHSTKGSAARNAAANSPADEIRRARKSGRAVSVAIARSPRTIALPDALTALLADALDAYALGHSVELAVNARRAEAPNPYIILDRDPNDELTTQEAAAALRVSRPTIIKAIDEGRLPARLVGKHRRVRIYDFNAYARAEMESRAAHGVESTRLEQEWGLHEVSPPPTAAVWKALAGRDGATSLRATKPERK